MLFVGEALVGNDGVDQLDKFNKALERECVDSSRPRGIDGIVLTKFDTIDDKVGASLSSACGAGAGAGGLSRSPHLPLSPACSGAPHRHPCCLPRRGPGLPRPAEAQR